MDLGQETNRKQATNRNNVARDARSRGNDTGIGKIISRGGGPRLNAAEWITLLDIHQRHHGAVLGPTHPELVDASLLLSTYAAARGRARGATTLRSPEGLARRLSTFRALENGTSRQLPSLAVAIWDRLINDPQTCRELALTTLALFEDQPRHAVRPSRGPGPWAGEVTVSRTSGRVFVYLMIFEAYGVPVRKHGLAVLKIGMSCDLMRRETELNRSIPAVLGLRWRRFAAVELPTADDAFLVEQTVLQSLKDAGTSLGFEFAMDDETRVLDVLSQTAGRPAEVV